MAYQMVAMAVTLNDFEGHSPVADVFTCNPLNICTAFYTISTDRCARMVPLDQQSFLSIAQSKNGHNISTDVAHLAVPLQQQSLLSHISLENSKNHKRWYYIAAHCRNVTVLRGNTIFGDFSVQKQNPVKTNSYQNDFLQERNPVSQQNEICFRSDRISFCWAVPDVANKSVMRMIEAKVGRKRYTNEAIITDYGRTKSPYCDIDQLCPDLKKSCQPMPG